MSILFRDRLYGADFNTPPSGPAVLPGRWQVRCMQGTAYLNGIELASPMHLVGGTGRQWRLAEEKGDFGGELFDGGAYDADIMQTYRLLGSGLGVGGEAKDWLYWTRRPPLELGLERHLELLPIEREAERALPYVEHVCAQPLTLLRHEVERLPVGRVRRMALDAPRKLATNTRDWNRRTFRGVEPSFLRANVLEEELDTYENRVVARVIDQTIAHLNVRLRRLNDRQKAVEEAANLTRDIEGGSFWRSARLSNIWGDSLVTANADEALRGLVNRLESVRQRFLALKASTVYKSVTRVGAIGRELKLTNVLISDVRYRRTAELWASLTNARQEKRLTEDGQDRVDLFHWDFAQYCSLLTVRALNDLGWAAEDPSKLVVRPSDHLLTRMGDRIRVVFAEDGTLSISRVGMHRELRVVPIASDLLANDAEDEFEAAVMSLGLPQGSNSKDREYLVILPITNSGRLQSASPERLGHLHHVGGDPGSAEGLDVTMVSPLHLNATEQIARSLRWWYSAPKFLQFPLLTVGATSGQQPGVWTAPEQARSVQKELERRRRELESSRKQKEPELRQSGRRRRSFLYNELAKIDSQLSVLTEQLTLVISSEAHLTDLRTCLVCETESTLQEFIVGEGGTFASSCHSCNTRWGVRICGKCQERVPYLLPSVRRIAGSDNPFAMDRMYGRDILSIPELGDSKLNFYCRTCMDFMP